MYSKDSEAINDKFHPDRITQPIVLPDFPGRRPAFSPDSLTVKFVPGLDTSQIIEDLKTAYAADARAISPGARGRLENTFYLKVKPEDLAKILGDLKVRDDVIYAERVAYRYTC